MNQSRLSLLALHFISGIGDRLIRQLVSYCGAAEKVFDTPKGKLMKIPGIGAVTAEAIKRGQAFALAEQEVERAARLGASLVFYTDPEYPSRLRNIPDAPTLLYTQGHMNLEFPRTVGIVGTRRATAYGRRCVEQLVEALVPYGTTVISGLAYGIDIHAHKCALRHNLPTIGILGSGLDVIYPAIHKETAYQMQDDGGLVTENPFGTQPDAHNFPARNRIIAGLTDALIVVEAGKTGGALITAEIANSYHKDVFAFPGNIGQSYSIGCNQLIKSNKAALIESATDLIYMMDWKIDGVTAKDEVIVPADLNESEQLVIKTLLSNGGTLVLDELSWKANLPASQLASLLLTLEIKGIIQPLPGKLFRLQKHGLC